MDLSLYSCQNSLLNALPQDDFEDLIKDCKLIEFCAGEIVNDSEQSIDSILFPYSSIISLVHDDFNGKATELAAIGNNGAVGVESCMNESPAKFSAIATHSGLAYQMKKSTLIEGYKNKERFRYQIKNFHLNLNAQIAYTAICNRFHKIEQQYCKFLLLCSDWIDGDLSYTQEAIGNILGVRRETITGIAFKLSEEEIIKTTRGKISILNRQALEDYSCDCYQAIKATLQSENRIHKSNRRHRRPITPELIIEEYIHSLQSF